MDLKLKTLDTFNDLIGKLEVLTDVVFLSDHPAFHNLRVMREARVKLSLLGNYHYFGKNIVVSCTIKDTKYLLFYSTLTGVFSTRRIFDDKISDITLYKNEKLNIAVFLGCELDTLLDTNSSVNKWLVSNQNLLEGQRVIVIMECDHKNISTKYYSKKLRDLYPMTEVIMYINDDDTFIDKNERAFELC
jgi:hypothetical protein